MAGDINCKVMCLPWLLSETVVLAISKRKRLVLAPPCANRTSIRYLCLARSSVRMGSTESKSPKGALIVIWPLGMTSLTVSLYAPDIRYGTMLPVVSPFIDTGTTAVVCFLINLIVAL